MTLDELRAAVIATASPSVIAPGDEIEGCLLTGSQVDEIALAASEYAASLIEQYARSPLRTPRGFGAWAQRSHGFSREVS